MLEKKLNPSIKFIAFFVLLLGNLGQLCAQKVKTSPVVNMSSKNSDGKILKMVTDHKGPVISADHPDVLASANRSGFETGQVVKINDVYHMFVNEMFEHPHRDMRIAYWTSNDAINWKRQSTIVNSIPGRTPSNPRSEVWVTGVVFNEEEDAWNIFYVAYRAGDSTKGEIAGNDYEGRIWRAKSVVKGRDGIAGPYADMGIMMEPDEHSQPWEGQQAVACFNPYKVGNTWFSMYDGHYHTPKGPWPTGIAFAPKLTGPWTRMPEGFNPIPVADVFMENEIVYKLKDGRYVMIFDSFGDHEIGYSISNDGLNWSRETRVKVQSPKNLWAEAGDHYTRTPLCAIEEEDGTFTVIYTAMTKVNNKNFYAIGKCSLAWQ
ncbi:hypothetical protein OCK74_16130 [Chitinophagaceae bacterium LB-8]|uniref:Glycosyl hydrolases family 43 n=1 Tax=Paraflavisolibacter caeni TaxID=2982496 RepID=A0A9X2XP81_9BACT|nr:hypothetical protein [Paraflavisolibacter caeni]MCU7550648.1 hypothetical protein [Paraflavisolibacter caeni]